MIVIQMICLVIMHTINQTSNISSTLVGNKIVDHSDASRRCFNYIFILDLTPGGEPTKIVANVISFEM